MKVICFLFIFPTFVFGQGTFSLPKEVETKGYTQAIAEYIKAIYAKDKTSFDTLFIGKYKGFPNIELPNTIQNTKILLLTSEEAEKKLQYRKSFTYINMIGDFWKNTCNFKLVVFITEKLPLKINWWPLHDCIIDFTYSLKKNVFDLKTLRFDYSYSNKYTEKK